VEHPEKPPDATKQPRDVMTMTAHKNMAPPAMSSRWLDNPGFVSAKFRRNFSFPLGTGKKYFGIFGKFRFENSKFKKIRPKFTGIPERNSVSADHRDFTGKQNG
jgi:hypothetical protein